MIVLPTGGRFVYGGATFDGQAHFDRPVESAAVAVGETVILMAPPCTSIRCFDWDKQGVSSK